MSINEVIKKYLPVSNKKISKANKQYNYCFAYSYQNCVHCKEIKQVKCCQKLIYQSFIQFNSKQWHLYFSCSNNHSVIRWVKLDGQTILVGVIKN